MDRARPRCRAHCVPPRCACRNLGAPRTIPQSRPSATSVARGDGCGPTATIAGRWRSCPSDQMGPGDVERCAASEFALYEMRTRRWGDHGPIMSGSSDWRAAVPSQLQVSFKITQSLLARRSFMRDNCHSHATKLKRGFDHCIRSHERGVQCLDS
jgi:hypothetical protein